MNRDVKANEWQLYGHCMDASYPADCQKPILLPEQESNLGVRPHGSKPTPADTKVPPASFGMPIDANLAIKLIQNAYGGTSEFFDAYLEKHEHGTVDDKEMALNTVLNLQNLMYGVAFNKTIILKILSQPNCEGIRSYLCARQITADTLHYSLIMVGVDINGYDLNYPPAQNTTTSGNMNNSMTTGGVQTLSLIGEYGNPPGGPHLLGYGKNIQVDDHYYLLKQAKPTADKV
jgi:hypothetical protein